MRKIPLFLFFVLSVHFLPAFESPRFFWSLGDVGISYRNLENNTENTPDTVGFVNAGRFNWITQNGLGWGASLFTLEGGGDFKQALILPLEFSYSPFGDNSLNLFLSLYARGGFMIDFTKGAPGSFLDRSSFFGAAGLRFSWSPLIGEQFSLWNGAFVEFTSKKEIRIGASIDVSVLAVLFLGTLGSDDDD